MASGPRTPEDMPDEKLAELAQSFIRRTFIHHGLWFENVSEKVSLEAAIECDEEVWLRLTPIWEKRLTPYLGNASMGGLSDIILSMSREEKLGILADLAKNWLALDGVWFQAVENRHGMDKAKECNNASWLTFAFVEAKHTLTILEREEGGGIEALDECLNFRLYARINKQTTYRIDANIL